MNGGVFLFSFDSIRFFTLNAFVLYCCIYPLRTFRNFNPAYLFLIFACFPFVVAYSSLTSIIDNFFIATYLSSLLMSPHPNHIPKYPNLFFSLFFSFYISNYHSNRTAFNFGLHLPIYKHENNLVDDIYLCVLLYRINLGPL